MLLINNYASLYGYLAFFFLSVLESFLNKNGKTIIYFKVLNVILLFILSEWLH